MNKSEKVKAKRKLSALKQPIYVQTYPNVGALVTGLTSSPSIMTDEMNPSAKLVMKSNPIVIDLSSSEKIVHDDDEQRTLSEPIDNQSQISTTSQHTESVVDSGLSSATETPTNQDAEKSQVDDELSTISCLSSIQADESNTITVADTPDAKEISEPKTIAQPEVISASTRESHIENDLSKSDSPSVAIKLSSENSSNNEHPINPRQMKTSNGKGKSKRTSLKKQLQNLLKIDKSSSHDEIPSIDESFNGKKSNIEPAPTSNETKAVEQTDNKCTDEILVSSPEEKPSDLSKSTNISEIAMSSNHNDPATLLSPPIHNRSRSGSPGDRNSTHHSNNANTAFVDNMRNQRQREKQELSHLNDRFRGYLDRVKVLENKNSLLTNDLMNIIKTWDHASQEVIGKYSTPLDRLRRDLNNTMLDEADVQARLYRDRFTIDRYRSLLQDEAMWNERQENKREQLKIEVDRSFDELNSLQESCKLVDEQVKELLKKKSQQIGELDHLNEEFYQATMDRIRVDLHVQTLREEIPFFNDLYAQLFNEFDSLKTKSGMDVQLFYRQELQKAIREIRGDFETLHNAQRKEMEGFYQMKIDELRNDAKKLADMKRNDGIGRSTEDLRIIKGDISDAQDRLSEEKARHGALKDRFARLEEELRRIREQREDASLSYGRELNTAQEKVQKLETSIDSILRGNITLESEINIYRRLLDGETRRLTIPTPEPVTTYEPAPASFGSELGKVFNKKIKRGPISIKDCLPDGRCIVLENTAVDKDTDVSGWALKRSVQGFPEINYTIPSNIIMRPGSELRIFARNAPGAQHRPPYQLLNDQVDSWGMSTKCDTRLYNEQGDERASHSQTIVFGSDTVHDDI